MSQIEDQFKMYQEGLTYQKIADRTNSTAAEVQRRIRAWHLQPTASQQYLEPKEFKDLCDRIRNLFNQGKRMKTIARQVGIEEIMVYRYLQGMGLK